jgi:3-oxoacyl-[acyl-carrier-protein] synthase II
MTIPAAAVDDPRFEKAVDRAAAFARIAAIEAILDADLERVDFPRNEWGCCIGTSKGSLAAFSKAYVYHRENRQTESRSFPRDPWPGFAPNGPARAVAAELSIGGPMLCPVAACATGLTSVIAGADLVARGVCPIALAGGADASLHPAVAGSFRRLGVLAKHDPAEPQAACRPFDANRTGFVPGEAAAVLVLEDVEHAADRGASWYAEFLAGDTFGDTTGLAQLEERPEGLIRLIGNLMDRAYLRPRDIDYIGYHGTGTRSNDSIETLAVHGAMSIEALRTIGSSLKGAIGHTLGAAGAVELAACALALRDGVAPPTLNLTNPDFECDLEYTPLVAVRRPLRSALKLSLGFGGHLAAAIIQRGNRPNRNAVSES